MSDVEQGQHPGRNWQSVRTVVEGLILAGVLWLANSTQQQATATVELRAQLQAMGDEIRSLRTQLADVPSMSRQIAQLQVRQDEHERRIGRIEDAEASGRPELKRWTKP